jgi:hypothetical protein
MKNRTKTAKAGLLLALIVTALSTTFMTGCVVEPYHEGYYDRPHHRYWHDHRWRDCDADDLHCR